MKVFNLVQNNINMDNDLSWVKSYSSEKEMRQALKQYADQTRKDLEEYIGSSIKELNDMVEVNWGDKTYTQVSCYVTDLNVSNPIKSDTTMESSDYVEEITGNRPTHDITLEKLEEMKLNKLNYPITEIEHLIENDLEVVLVRFPNEYMGYDYRFCEL